MDSLVLPFFGEIDIEPLLEIYQTTIKINDSDVILSLNFPNYSEYYDESIKEVKGKNEIFEEVLLILQDILELERNNRLKIDEEFKLSESHTNFFLKVCFREFKNEITDIIDVNLSEKENLIYLKDNLLLRKINIYPKADDTDYIHFEYHLAEISSCTLDVYYDNQQHITGVNYSIPFAVFIKYME